MKVVNEFTLYEDDDWKGENTVRVESHWNYTDRFWLVMPDGKRWLAMRAEFENAMQNACNHK